MAGFSVSQAIGSGFRLIGREPAAVLAWFVAYLVYVAVFGGLLMVVAPDFISQYLALGRAGPNPSAAQVAELTASIGPVLKLAPVLLLGGLAFNAVLLGAIYRAVLAPEARRFAYLRFGRQELWLLLSFVVCGLVVMLIYVCIVFALALVGGLLGVGLTAAGGNQMAAVAAMAVGVLAGVALTVWMAIRLFVSLPISFQECRFVVFEGWRATRGQAVPVLWVGLALLGIMIGLEFVIMMIFYALGASVPAGVGSGLGLGTIVSVVLMALVGTGFYVILAAPAADIYRQLKGEDLSVFS